MARPATILWTAAANLKAMGEIALAAYWQRNVWITAILELESQRVEADTLDGLKNLVGSPLLQEHNLAF